MPFPTSTIPLRWVKFPPQEVFTLNQHPERLALRANFSHSPAFMTNIFFKTFFTESYFAQFYVIHQSAPALGVWKLDKTYYSTRRVLELEGRLIDISVMKAEFVFVNENSIKKVKNKKIFICLPFLSFPGPLSEVQTATGLEVTLPCDLFPNSMSSPSSLQDKVTLVIWYKEGNQKPIYS